MSERADVWDLLRRPLNEVAYEANIVSRLDAVVPGEWDLTLELQGTPQKDRVSYKARLQILGVIREGVAIGASYQSAAFHAFSAAARLFGIRGTTG